jgi:hypothetical protein
LGFGAGAGILGDELPVGGATGVTLGYWKVWDAACMSMENYASAAAELRPPALSDVVRRVEQDPLRHPAA